MRICKLCCKEIEQIGIWRIKEDRIEDYCYRCGVWLVNSEHLVKREEETNRIMREFSSLMEEKKENSEYLQKRMSEGATNISRIKELDK